MFGALLDFEEKRKRLAMEWMEKARSPAGPGDSARHLALRIVEKAKALEKSVIHKDKGRSTLSRLEDLMYAINPEALR